jgi:RNA polymerase sigma factor (sigma-70 family)
MASAKKRRAEAKPQTTEEQQRAEELQRYIDLVDIVRHSKNKKKAEDAFEDIKNLMEKKILQMCYKFNIPGYAVDDVHQEALLALRYKAIQDYDKARSLSKDVSPFDRFAILCIRRHLSTKLKSSYQNKSRAQNTAISLDQDRNHSSDSDGSLFLVDIAGDQRRQVNDRDQLSTMRDKERCNTLFSKLYERLSPFEKKVFVLYCQHMSYDQMVVSLNKKNKNERADLKSIDNALMRIKYKAAEVKKKFDDEG